MLAVAFASVEVHMLFSEAVMLTVAFASRTSKGMPKLKLTAACAGGVYVPVKLGLTEA